MVFLSDFVVRAIFSQFWKPAAFWWKFDLNFLFLLGANISLLKETYISLYCISHVPYEKLAFWGDKFWDRNTFSIKKPYFDANVGIMHVKSKQETLLWRTKAGLFQILPYEKARKTFIFFSYIVAIFHNAKIIFHFSFRLLSQIEKIEMK